MLDTLDALIATIGIVFVLSLIVQAIQQIIKQLFSFKSRYMERELMAMLGAKWPSTLAAPLAASIARRLPENQGIVKVVNALRAKLEGLGYNDLSLLEKMSPSQFMAILEDVGTSLQSQQDDSVKKVLTNVRTDVSKWYDLTMQAFQDHYERRMKLWAYMISLVLAALLNVSLFEVYREFASDRELRESAIRATERIMSEYETQRTKVTGGNSSAAIPSKAAVDSQLARIDTLVFARSFQLLRWDGPGRPDLVEGTQSWTDVVDNLWAGFRNNLWGIIVMALLVGLGAPFWYDILKTFMGLKQRAGGESQNNDASKRPPAHVDHSAEDINAARSKKIQESAAAEERALQSATQLTPPAFSAPHGRIL